MDNAGAYGPLGQVSIGAALSLGWSRSGKLVARRFRTFATGSARGGHAPKHRHSQGPKNRHSRKPVFSCRSTLQTIGTRLAATAAGEMTSISIRSEERRVGKECR